MLGRHGALEGDALGFRDRIAVAMLGEVKALLLLQRGLQVLGAADEPSLALFAHAAAENRLHKNFTTRGQQFLYLVFASLRSQHVGSRKVDKLQEPRTVEHASNVHSVSPC